MSDEYMYDHELGLDRDRKAILLYIANNDAIRAHVVSILILDFTSQAIHNC